MKAQRNTPSHPIAQASHVSHTVYVHALQQCQRILRDKETLLIRLHELEDQRVTAQQRAQRARQARLDEAIAQYSAIELTPPSTWVLEDLVQLPTIQKERALTLAEERLVARSRLWSLFLLGFIGMLSYQIFVSGWTLWGPVVTMAFLVILYQMEKSNARARQQSQWQYQDMLTEQRLVVEYCEDAHRDAFLTQEERQIVLDITRGERYLCTLDQHLEEQMACVLTYRQHTEQQARTRIEDAVRKQAPLTPGAMASNERPAIPVSSEAHTSSLHTDEMPQEEGSAHPPEEVNADELPEAHDSFTHPDAISLENDQPVLSKRQWKNKRQKGTSRRTVSLSSLRSAFADE